MEFLTNRYGNRFLSIAHFRCSLKKVPTIQTLVLTSLFNIDHSPIECKTVRKAQPKSAAKAHSRCFVAQKVGSLMPSVRLHSNESTRRNAMMVACCYAAAAFCMTFM